MLGLKGILLILFSFLTAFPSSRPERKKGGRAIKPEKKREIRIKIEEGIRQKGSLNLKGKEEEKGKKKLPGNVEVDRTEMCKNISRTFLKSKGTEREDVTCLTTFGNSK